MLQRERLRLSGTPAGKRCFLSDVLGNRADVKLGSGKRYLREPGNFRCARVTAWVGDDPLLPWFGGGPALLVSQQAGAPAPGAATARYCDVVTVRIDALFQ